MILRIQFNTHKHLQINYFTLIFIVIATVWTLMAAVAACVCVWLLMFADNLVFAAASLWAVILLLPLHYLKV